MSLSLEDQILSEISQILQQTSAAPATRVHAIMGKSLFWRCLAISQHVLNQYHGVVQGGPFASMQYLTQSAGSFLTPKLLGCYEEELHETIAQIIRTPYQRVLNIGCGEGYYAVGLARAMPSISVVAFDSNSTAQILCKQLAELNGVAERVEVYGTCDFSQLEQTQKGRTLVVCDCEGGELELLDPAKVPGLLACDILVEMHDFLKPNTSRGLTDRFTPSHEVKFIPNAGRNPNSLAALASLQEIDQAIAVWEGRPGPTPWAFMTARGNTP